MRPRLTEHRRISLSSIGFELVNRESKERFGREAGGLKPTKCENGENEERKREKRKSIDDEDEVVGVVGTPPRTNDEGSSSSDDSEFLVPPTARDGEKEREKKTEGLWDRH